MAFLGHLSGPGVEALWRVQRAGPQGLLSLRRLSFSSLIQSPFVVKAQVLLALSILYQGGSQPPTCQMDALTEEV